MRGRLTTAGCERSICRNRGSRNVPAAPRNATSSSTSSALAELAKQPDYAFKTRLFWIVSRTNDCQYCLGHQELKLRRAGMTEEEIAALDSKWSVFPEDEQSAMVITRKITLTPHLVTDADLATLKGKFSDAQIVELIQTVAGYNSTNRWTTATGIPQDQSFGGENSELDTPTSEAFAKAETKVAPLDYIPRPAWESRSATEAAMKACESRVPLVALPTADTARRLMAADSPGTAPPVWFQAMSGNPPAALRSWRHRQALVRDGKLDPVLRAEIAWVCAREDRAWYAAAHALARLEALGMATDAIWQIGQREATATPTEAAVVAFAKKLTSSPHLMTDADVTGLQTLLSDYEVAEVIFLVCEANSFDRFTEMLRLPREGGMVVAERR